MRSIRWLAAVTGTLALATACGGGGGDVGVNEAPVANFTPNCTDLVCNFTDASTDDNGVTVWVWDFTDGATSPDKSPAHTFMAANTYNVKLTVTDGGGLSNSKTIPVTVTAGGTPGNVAPTADFSESCSAFDCTFTDRSIDSDGNIALQSWDFGDGSVLGSGTPATHKYATAGTYTVMLTVTDNGGLTALKTDAITISAPAGLQCADAGAPGGFVDCSLKLKERANVTFTLFSRSCTARGNRLNITAPVMATVFTSGCYNPAVGTIFTLPGGPYPIDTEIKAQFISGSVKQKIAPTTIVTGVYPDWELRFDDGEDAPADNDDIVVTVHATPAP